jgi:hypothetical protein
MALAGKGQSFPASGLMRESKTYNLHVCFQIFVRRTCRIGNIQPGFAENSFLQFQFPTEMLTFFGRAQLSISVWRGQSGWESKTLVMSTSATGIQRKRTAPVRCTTRKHALTIVDLCSGSLPSVPQICAKVLLKEEGSASCSSCLCRGIQFHRYVPHSPCLEICLFCSSSL